MQTYDTSAGDGFVIAMLAMIALSMSVIGLLFLSMRANARRRNQAVDDLLDEVAEGEQPKTAPTQDQAKPPAPWERDGDWWKS